jgi:AcrR family transcriptional regulator
MSTYHHGDLRTATVQAAEKILEEQGLGALSIREAARRAGVSHNAPYRHFPDRDSLLAELAAQGFRLLGDELRTRRGREMGEAYVRFALAHPERFRLMFGPQLRHERHPALREAAQHTYNALVSAFRADGAIADPEKAAAAAWSLVHGLAHLILDGQLKNDTGFIREVIGAVRFAAASRG